MADPKPLASTYAVPSTDEETLRKRRDLASRLFQAKQAGKSMNEAVMSESGVDVGNLQKGSVDVKMGTGLTEEEVAGFAERLYAGKYGQAGATEASKGSIFDQQEKAAQAASTASGAFGGPNSKGTSSQYQVPTPRLDRLAAMQGSPMGSVSIGAKGVQGATGGLARGSSPTGGTPIGGGGGIGASPFGTKSSAARQMNAITGANLFFAAEERRRQLEEQAAREKGFNMAYGNQSPPNIRGYEYGRPIAKMPFYEAATYNIR